MKKVLFFMFLFLTTLFLVSCDRDIDLDLNTPTNVTIQNGVVSWQAVSEADSYIVLVGLVEYPVTQTSLDLTTLSLSPGNYDIRVFSVKGDTQSIPSAAIVFTVESGEITSLATPQNLRVISGVLTWNAVLNAQAYVVYVGAQSFNVTTNTFDLNALELEEGDYDILVKATRGTIESSLSAVQTYRVTLPVDEGYILLSILQALNPMFELEMSPEDFEYENDFRDYARFEAFAISYTTAALSMQMTEEDTIGLFMHVMSIPEMMMFNPSASTFFDMMDFFGEFGVTDQSLAYMLFELFIVAVEQSRADQVFWLELAQQYLLEDIEYLNDFLQTETYIQTLNLFVNYMPLDYMHVLDSFLNDPYDWDKMFLVWDFTAIFNDVYYNYDFHDMYYYEYHYNIYVQAVYAMFVEMYLNDEMEALDSIAVDPHQFIQPFNDFLVRQQNVDWWYVDIANYEEQILMLDTLLLTLNEERDLFIETLEEVIAYFNLMMNSMSVLSIDLLDELIMSDDLSLEEIFLLKDEIVAMLSDTMPSSEDMSLLFLSLMYIGEAIGELEVELKDDYALFLAEVNHAIFDLGLTLVADIDQLFVESFLIIAEDLMMEGQYYCYDFWHYDYILDDYVWVEYCDYGGDEVNPVTAIELIVFVGTYLQDFHLRHEVEFANLEVAFGMPIFDLLVDELLFSFLALTEADMSEEEALVFAYIVDEVMADLDTYRNALAILAEVGLGVLNVFFEDEGQFIIDLILFDEIRYVVDEPEVVQYVQLLLQGFIPYNEAFLMLRNLESIEAVLNILRLPVKAALVIQQGMNPEEVDLLLNELMPPLAEIILAFANLEVLFLQAASEFEWANWIFNNDFNQDNTFAIILGTILVFDQILVEVEDELLNAINVLFDDVLGHDFVMMMLGFEELELEELKAFVVQMFEELVLGVREIGLLDFNNLSEEDFMMIEDFIYMITEMIYGFTLF